MFAVGNALPGATCGDLWGRMVVSGGVGVGGTLGHLSRVSAVFVCGPTTERSEKSAVLIDRLASPVLGIRLRLLAASRARALAPDIHPHMW